ncbi:unnamed protein product [Cylindrotheca closterium]|uniref:Uncharacterized protein n=1 Tax=Cylindrotheca closterium TaxID=2856 RepID=A0AAD2CDL6_9STRA|nr:unnamed protein product [Cylindrotheca closterium]
MSSWMTSGKARLNARQNRTFEKRAQQRARVMTAPETNSGSSVPQRILRERQISHPNANANATANTNTNTNTNAYYHPGDPNRGMKRNRNSNIEIISGEQAKAKYSPNNPIRRRGVIATARRIHHAHSLDEHHHWQQLQSQSHSYPPPQNGGEYLHAPPYHPDPHYDQHDHNQQHHHHHRPHRYPPHHQWSGDEHSRSYHHHSRRNHHYPNHNHSRHRMAPYIRTSTGRETMTYDYKTAQWVPLPSSPQPYEPPPSDPIKEAQVYPSAQEPLLEKYQHHPQQYYHQNYIPRPPFENRQPPHYKYHASGGWESSNRSKLDENELSHHHHTHIHPKPPFQDKQLPHYKHPGGASGGWESSNRSKHDEDDYLYYGDQTSVGNHHHLETATSFEMPPDPNENVYLPPPPPPQLAGYETMGGAALAQATITMGHDHKSAWDQDIQPPHLQHDYDRQHDDFQLEESAAANEHDVIPKVQYSKSEMEPWEVADDQQQLQQPPMTTTSRIERSNTWSPGSAAERQSFTLTSSSRGRRISRYSPPKLPYSPPRLPEGLERFQKKRRVFMTPTATSKEEQQVGEEEDEASLSSQAAALGPRLFNNGVQVNEDGTPLVFGPPVDASSE